MLADLHDHNAPGQRSPGIPYDARRFAALEGRATIHTISVCPSSSERVMTESQIAECLEAVDCWIESAVWVGLSFRMAGATEARWGAHYDLLQLSRLQFACGLSFYRIQEPSATVVGTDLDTEIFEIGRVYADVHAFLVSAHSYWRALRGCLDKETGGSTLTG
jgi:hypothetical protein